MKDLMIAYYVNKFGTLSLSQLCVKNKDHSAAKVREQAEMVGARGRITKTETAHHISGVMVVKYHSLVPVTRKIKTRKPRKPVEKTPQMTLDVNRLKRIIAVHPGINHGRLAGSARTVCAEAFELLKTDDEVMMMIEKHARTGVEYVKYYLKDKS